MELCSYIFSPARSRLPFLLLLPFMVWASAGLFLLFPSGANAADLPDAGSLCAAKCGTCPVICATPPPPQSSAISQLPPPPPPPPPAKKSGQSPPVAPSPPAGGQRGLSYPYYYFYTPSAVPHRSPAPAECLLLLLFLVVAELLR